MPDSARVVPAMQLPLSPLLGSRTMLVYATLADCLDMPGDIAECGAHDCVTAAGMARLVRERGYDKRVHGFDTFEGFPDLITEEEAAASTWPELAGGRYPADRANVARNVANAGNVVLYEGRFSDTFPGFTVPLCFIHSDSDLYTSTLETIALAERLLVPGGRILFDDYGNPRMPGVQLAVDRGLDPERFDGGRVPGTIQFLARRR